MKARQSAQALNAAYAVGFIALGYGLALFLTPPPQGNPACAAVTCPACSCPAGATEGASQVEAARSLAGDPSSGVGSAGGSSGGDPSHSRDPKIYNAQIATLLKKVKQNAGADVVEKCLKLIRGGRLTNTFAQAGQDWLLFHNYFSHVPYGQGSYIDIGSNHPKQRSNTFFFDRCLGWKGVCVEPNADYHKLYKQHKRTCKLVKSCVADHPGVRGMNFSEAEFGALKAKGDGNQVECRSLSEVIKTFGLQGADLATIDIEGAEYEALRCFPFRAHSVATWLVETNKADERLARLFQRGGYAPVADVIMGGYSYHSATTRVGIKLDTVFRPVDPPFILGPEFLPGRSLHGQGPRPPCPPGIKYRTPECPEQMPSIFSDEVTRNMTLKDGVCGIPDGAMEVAQVGGSDAVLTTARDPASGFGQ